MKKITYLVLLLATMATSVRAIDPPNIGQPAPAAWTRETFPGYRANEVAEYHIQWANDFNGPWHPAPIVIPGEVSAQFMTLVIHELLVIEMEEHVTGESDMKFFRYRKSEDQ